MIKDRLSAEARKELEALTPEEWVILLAELEQADLEKAATVATEPETSPESLKD